MREMKQGQKHPPDEKITAGEKYLPMKWL